jgi:hypothetical protein
VARRIEIELTSARQDETWTWRAAGAREPKGTLDGKILPEGAKVGDVLRADAEFEIDGIVILSVTAPKQKRPEEGRLELLGPARSGPPGVTTQLVRRGERRGREERPGRHRTRPARSDASGRTNGGAPPREEGADHAGRSERRTSGHRRSAAGGGKRPTATRSQQQPAGTTAGSQQQPTRTTARSQQQPAGTTARSQQSRGRRLNPANAHRSAVLDSLPVEQRPVAEQVLRGGIPAVRTAIHLEREKAAAEGRPLPNADALMSMAEDLQPRLKAAEWRDRAEAVDRAGEAVALRDLRSIVAGADAARDAESRQLAATLRERLEGRVEASRSEWRQEVGKHLDEGRLVRALRLAARSPDPHARLPAEVGDRLAADAGAAMTAEAAPQRWLALLDAVAASPVRRTVHPAGLPANADPELLRTAHQQAGRVPALAGLLGLPIPPPPGPVRAASKVSQPHSD